MAGIAIEKLVKRYGSTQVVHGIDLDIQDGEFVVFVGPSGCGKSTTLRMIAGLEDISDGTIAIGGRTVNRLEPKERNIAMVFQNYAIYPHMSVAENIAFGPRESGTPAAERRAIAEKLMAQVGLTQFANHYPKQLSGGMQQRAALARALANDPKVLLLDEPFGALDHQTRSLMQELLLSIWEEHRKTVLFVTHDIEEAVFMANRVLVMSARPGRFKSEVAIPFAHPRSYKLKTTPEFGRLEEQLTEDIRSETIIAVQAGF